jgi:hypothetical protein
LLHCHFGAPERYMCLPACPSIARLQFNDRSPIVVNR